MTTIEAEHAFTVYCRGKSCADLYVLACEENGVRPNTALLATLPTKVDWFEMEEIDVSKNYLGIVGSHCLLDLIRANKLLMRLSLKGQGADDETIRAIVSTVRNHERLGHLDLSDNAEVTAEVVDPIVKLMRENKMVVEVNMRGTRVGAATQRLLDRMGRENSLLEANFFKGDFIRLKRTFAELDTEGNGRISVSALLTQIEIPQVAAALEKRFAQVDDGGVTDGYLDMTEFLRFTYPGFQKLKVLTEHLKRDDRDEDVIVANWKVIVEALRRGRMEFPGLHLARIYHREIALEEAIQLLRLAMEHMWKSGDEAQMTEQGKMILQPRAVAAAVKDMFGAEFNAIETARYAEWGSARITPGIARLMAQAFGTAHGSGDVATDGGSTMYDVSLASLLEASTKIVRTETVKFVPEVIAAKLRAAGIGGTIRFTFPEWFCYINEARDQALYPICAPASFSVEDAMGNSPVQDTPSPADGSTNTAAP